MMRRRTVSILVGALAVAMIFWAVPILLGPPDLGQVRGVVLLALGTLLLVVAMVVSPVGRAAMGSAPWRRALVPLAWAYGGATGWLLIGRVLSMTPAQRELASSWFTLVLLAPLGPLLYLFGAGKWLAWVPGAALGLAAWWIVRGTAQRKAPPKGPDRSGGPT